MLHSSLIVDVTHQEDTLEHRIKLKRIVRLSCHQFYVKFINLIQLLFCLISYSESSFIQIRDYEVHK